MSSRALAISLLLALLPSSAPAADGPAPPTATTIVPLVLLDDLGRPIVGATVWANLDGPLTFHTDAEGGARVPASEDGRPRLYVESVSAPAYPHGLYCPDDGGEELTLAPGETLAVVVKVTRCAPVSLAVIDSEGRPAGGAEVHLEHLASAAGDARDAPLEADAAGLVTPTAVPLGAREILVIDREHLAATRTAIAVTAAGGRFVLRLPPPAAPARLTLSLVDADGRPFAPIGALWLGASPANEALRGDLVPPRMTALAGDEQTLVFDGLVPGTWTAIVAAARFPLSVEGRERVVANFGGEDDGFVIGRVDVDAPAGASLSARVVLRRTGLIRGRVTLDGSPFPGASVKVLTAGQTLDTSADEQGRFEVAGDGLVVVRAYQPLGEEKDGEQPIDLRSDERRLFLRGVEERVELELHASRRIAVAARYEDGNPVRDRSVYLWGRCPPEDSWLKDDGRARFDEVAPGRYFLSIDAEIREVEVGVAADLEYAFVLPGQAPAAERDPGAGTLTARIIEAPGAVPTPGGGPPAESYLLVYRGATQVTGAFPARGDGARFTLPAGRYDLLLVALGPHDPDDEGSLMEAIHAPRAPVATVDVAAGEEREAVLRPIGSGAIVVTATGLAEGASLGLASLAVVLPGGATLDVGNLEESDGLLRFGALAAGCRYRVYLETDNGRREVEPESIDVDFAPGQTAAVTFAVRPRRFGEIQVEGGGVNDLTVLREDGCNEHWVTPTFAESDGRRLVVSARVPAGRLSVNLVFVDPRDGETVNRSVGWIEVPADGVVTVRPPRLGSASLAAFVRSRARPTALVSLAGTPLFANANRPVVFDRLPAGHYDLRCGDAVLKSIDLADGERVDLGVIDAP